MNKYLDFFYPDKNDVPIEIQYEMLVCKLSNDEAEKTDIDSLLSKVEELKDEKSKSGP